MKVTFDLGKKKSEIDGREVEYYVLKRTLINGDVIELPLKKVKAQLLLMSLSIEDKK